MCDSIKALIGKAWKDEPVEVEPWQRTGASIACEPRYLDDLVEGIKEDGLVVEPE
jgi:hypothetical protein